MASSDLNPLNKAVPFRRELAAWFAREQRKLPWRTQCSLYRTVVSEFMLQQTQVKTALPYFDRWMRRFPDFDALAAAPAEAVLKHWEGLGYYSRARNLHRLAQAIADLPEVPATPEEWIKLPGIGPYTAAAISSIAQGYPAAVVDGNVVRILARLTGDERTFAGNAEAVKAFGDAATALLDAKHPGRHNEAMMELGATVCLKRSPLCTVCPVVRFCAAAAKGEPGSIPKIRRRATETVETTRLWVRRDGKLLLHRIPESASQLAGQYELPDCSLLAKRRPQGTVVGVKQRGITHRRITETILQVRCSPAMIRKVEAAGELHWIEIEALDGITLSGPHRRWVRELLENTSDA